MHLVTSDGAPPRFAQQLLWRIAYRVGTLGIIAAVPASAQLPADTARPPLLLGAVLDAVERANPRLDVARATARAARARVPGASRPPDPQLQLGWMNYDLATLRPMDAIGMTQLQLMQMVPVAGKLRLARLAEAARADATATRVADVSFDLRARTAMVFYDIYTVDNTLGVARDTRRLLQDVAEIASKMYQVGEGRQSDVLRANVELARMQEEIIRMEAMRTTMEARLNALRLAAAGSSVGAPSLPVFPAGVPTVDSLAQLAAQNRPMIRAGLQDVDAADASARLARKEIWPDVQLGLQLGRQGGPDGPQRMGSLMVGASLPIFANSRQFQMREEADAMRAMKTADVMAMRAETRGA